MITDRYLMSQEHRKKKNMLILNEFLDETSLNEMVEFAKESLNREGEEDSFEVYANNLRLSICANPDKFQRRFIDGYEILLEALRDGEKNGRPPVSSTEADPL
jgi:hypothetical protein